MLRFLALFLVFALFVDGAKAQPMNDSASPQETPTALERRAQDVLSVLNGEADGEEVFAPVFLNAVPMEQIDLIARQFNDQYGRALEVVELSPRTGNVSLVTIRLERAVGQVNLSVEGAGENRINGLQLLEFTPTNDTIEAIAAELDALEGEVSAYFGPLDGSAPTLSLNADAQMPLGSAMKLYVLGALGEEIAQGERAWDDVIALDTKSFPSGQMQNWPEGSPVTLHTLASLMISISDNTATDQLIRSLGRDRIAAFMQSTGHSEPAPNTPWMTTRELFLIKGGAEDQLNTYAQGTADQREAILARLEDNPATLAEINANLASGPVAIESVEWFANASDLAGLFTRMRQTNDPEVFRILGINPALSPSVTEGWSYVGFKGGSETGVLNMTWLLADKQGQERMLTLSWANREKPVETQTLLLIAQRIVSLAQ